MGILEIALRLMGISYPGFYRPDLHLGASLRPGICASYSKEGHSHVQINSQGWHDRERSLKKTRGVLRIAVLGDSFVEAFHVSWENSLCQVIGGDLIKRLAVDSQHDPVEVLNFGVSGYGTAQELLAYRHCVRHYSPDLVVLAVFTGNDIRENSRALERERTRPFFVCHENRLEEDDSFLASPQYRQLTSRRTRFIQHILDASYLAQFAYEYKSRFVQAMHPAGNNPGGLNDGVYLEPHDEAWSDAWRVTEALIAKLDEEVKADGSRLLVVTLSNPIQVHPDCALRARLAASLFYPDDRIEEFCRRNHIAELSLVRPLQRLADREHLFLHGFSNTTLGCGHWNENGHRCAGELISEYIHQNILPQLRRDGVNRR